MGRHAIRREALWRVPLLIIGATEKRSYVEITPDGVRVSFGIAKELVPLRNIQEAEEHPWPLLYGIGIRLGFGGIAYVGSTKGVVRIRLREAFRFNVLLGLRVAFDSFFVSLEDPAGFIAELHAALPVAPEARA